MWEKSCGQREWKTLERMETEGRKGNQLRSCCYREIQDCPSLRLPSQEHWSYETSTFYTQRSSRIYGTFSKIYKSINSEFIYYSHPSVRDSLLQEFCGEVLFHLPNSISQYLSKSNWQGAEISSLSRISFLPVVLPTPSKTEWIMSQPLEYFSPQYPIPCPTHL